MVLPGVEPFDWLPRGHDVESELEVLLRMCWDNHAVMQCSLEDRYRALLSPAALAFFKEVLVADPNGRPTPAQLLQHKYVGE
jgi:hypothetical protein